MGRSASVTGASGAQTRAGSPGQNPAIWWSGARRPQPHQSRNRFRHRRPPRL